MNIEKGDKVRFLNDVGGGVVTRIVGKTVYVEDNDGFEIPALITQVVLVETKEKPRQEQVRKVDDASLLTTSQRANDREADPVAYLAFLQGDKPNSQTGDFRVFFVNDSPFHVSYTVASSVVNASGMALMYQGVAEPFSKPLLDKVPGRLIDDKALVVQLLLFKKGGHYAIHEPVSNTFKMKLHKLVREGGALKNDYFEEKAFLFPVLKSKLHVKAEELIENGIAKDIPTQAKPTKSTRKLQPGETLEVDLHIHELVADSRGMSNSEMMKIQIDTFTHTIEEHLQTKGVRLIFIHGVGNGVLKQEIIRLLKSKYKHLYYQDASFKEYGYGATMVVI
ncbi:Smr/MutS family protein [Breznakibacter xylanolyticus]|nr:DUF2027 domain-containing protein [Breznakibacter xylanolyticus]MBN2743232.1 DUF2027 domain-containing protein [Marinilabiliaceae bacterium]